MSIGILAPGFVLNNGAIKQKKVTPRHRDVTSSLLLFNLDTGVISIAIACLMVH